ncbi:MAG: Rpp14/Pop5 family protein [Nitrososphaerales archaeon]
MKYERKRYILVYYEMQNDHKELETEITARVKDLFGAIGLQSIDLKLVKIEPNFLIIHCSHKHVDEALFALSSMKFKDSAFLPLRVSGTIKKLKRVMANFVKYRNL